MTDEHLEILLCDQEKKLRTVVVEKDEYDDLGLEFETYLMDRQMGCKMCIRDSVWAVQSVTRCPAELTSTRQCASPVQATR